MSAAVLWYLVIFNGSVPERFAPERTYAICQHDLKRLSLVPPENAKCTLGLPRDSSDRSNSTEEGKR